MTQGEAPAGGDVSGGQLPLALPMRGLEFVGIEGAVILPDDPAALSALDDCVKGWPVHDFAFTPGMSLASPPLCVVEACDDGTYRLHSRYMDQPLTDLPVATMICAVLADLSQAYSEQAEGHVFGLHCGGFALGGAGVILAGDRRAGKSTLISRLSAEADVQILCDDVLPLTVEAQMIGLGLAPRLRLPLPETAAPFFRNHVAEWLGPSDPRYGYLIPPNLMSHSTSVKAKVMILLDRKDTGEAVFHHLPQDEILRALVGRSIAGPNETTAVYEAAEALSAQLIGLRLVYSDLEVAVSLLRKTIGADGQIAVDHVIAALPDVFDNAAEPGAAQVALNSRWARANGVAARRNAEASFLWHRDEAQLWHLNSTAQIIWALLEYTASARELAADLKQLYPEASITQLRADARRMLGDLAQNGFVTMQGGTGVEPW